MLVAPSILSADFSCLKEDIQTVSDAEWLHIDVMDGHFVPNITIGPLIVEALRKHTKQILDTHLMITEPEKYVAAFIAAGSDQITFHVETVDNPQALIDNLHAKGVSAGISIKPDTPVESIRPFLKSLELILVMSVEPGFGGQAFIPKSLLKIAELNRIRKTHNYHFDIVVDGGINEETGALCKASGADVLVAGSFIFKAENRQAQIQKLRL